MAQDANIRPDINVELVRHLQDSNEIVLVSKLFASFKTNEQRVRFLFELMQERGFLPELSVDGKSSKTSEQYRREGNEMFKKRKVREALEFYTKSIAFAETEENKSLAYANRSAVLFEKGLYQECLCDIERALENNYPEALKPKLAARQSKARTLLPMREKIEFFTPVPSIPEADRNPLIQSAASSIKIENSEALGRHIVATRDIEPGEIIAIENPFCHNLIGQLYIHCHYCLKLCYTLIPCPNCTETLFCSEACQADANMAYHQYECPILLTIKHMDLSCRHLHLRVAILARDMYEHLDQCVLNDGDVYRSDRYNEIHNLVANTSKRSVSDLFNRGVHAAALYHLLKTHTKFFEARDEAFEATFKELLLFHMQTGPCNFHEINEMKTSDNSPDQQQIGEGVYSFLSMFNHSCSPNVARYYYGSTAIAITTEQIKKGQQCFDNYGYHSAVMLKADRKAKLKKQYFFDCSCTACTNNYPLFDSLPEGGNFKYAIASRDMEMLQKNDLETANRIFKKLASKITKLQVQKPNKILDELEESFKHCFFIFRMIKTPI